MVGTTIVGLKTPESALNGLKVGWNVLWVILGASAVKEAGLEATLVKETYLFPQVDHRALRLSILTLEMLLC